MIGSSLSGMERVNLALYQSAAASTRNSTYSHELAVDGIVGNFHAYRTLNTAGPHWLEVRFDRVVTIASAHVYSGLDNDLAQAGLSHFRIQFELNGSWVDVPGGIVTGNTEPEREVIFSQATSASRFRLYSTEGGSRVIRELALFGPNLVGGVEQGYPIGTGVRLSLGYQRPATASSILGAAYPKRAVDGYVDSDSGWLASEAGSFLEVDLLADHRVGSARLYSGTSSGAALANFVLEWWNGSTWQAIPGTNFTGNSSKTLDIPFGEAVNSPRIRLRITGGTPVPVRELLLFPPRDQAYPPGQDINPRPLPATVWDDFSDSHWRLRNGGPDLRLALSEGDAVLGRALDGVEAIEWQLLLNYRDDSFRIRHSATGLCLELATMSQDMDTPVVAGTYSALPHQDWRLDWINSSEFRITNIYSGLALQPANNSWAVGAGMVVRPADGSLIQRWRAIAPRHAAKKGLAATAAQLENYHAQFPSAWSYTWGRQRPLDFPFLPADHGFNPMQWGNFNWVHGTNQGPPDLLRNALQSHPLPTYLLGFNEPDKENQANMTVAAAISRWPRLEALNVPLVSPAPASAFNGWMAGFYDELQRLGYRSDYTAVHWYGNPDVNSLIAHLQATFSTFGRPVWLTEFSVVRWSGSTTWTDADNYNFLAEFLWRAESVPWLKRYSLFHFVKGPTDNPNQSANDPAEAPRSNSMRSDGSLTAFGELYASWDGVAAVLPHKAYHIHNRAVFQRMMNDGAGSMPTSVDPTQSPDGAQWVLVPGLAEDTYRIISTMDGRPLGWREGAGVGFGAPGHLNAAFEWRLVPDQDGWFFIEHPQANQRLKHNGPTGYSMVSSANTGNPIKWRFVIPLIPDDVAVHSDWTGYDGFRIQSVTTGTGTTPDMVQLEFPWQPDNYHLGWRMRRTHDLQAPHSWEYVQPQSVSLLRRAGRDWLILHANANLDSPVFFQLEVLER